MSDYYIINKLEGYESKADGDKFNISAMATTFEDPDRHGDTITPNAFNADIKRINEGNNLKILLNHNSNMPIGNWTKAVKNEKGIKLFGRISEATAMTKEVLALIRDGVYDKVSIGFLVKEYDEVKRGFRLLKGELIECSVVSVPANNNANILSVKHYDEMMASVYNTPFNKTSEWKGEINEIGKTEKAYNINKQELNEIVARSYKISITT